MPSRPTTPFLQRKQEILALVADLVGRLDELDLDAIDGAFFWRFCRPEVAAPLDRLRPLAGRWGSEARLNQRRILSRDLQFAGRDLRLWCRDLQSGAPALRHRPIG